MATALKKRKGVRFVIPDIVGQIKEARVNEDGEFLYLVEYKTADGEVHQRTFNVDDLIPEPDADEKPAPANT